MTAIVIRGDARRLPLPDASVDLVVTSPPYFGLRSYTDDGGHYDGQIGSEATPAEWLAALLNCTRDWVRVLKPEGSIFVNLGDKYAGGGMGGHGGGRLNGRVGQGALESGYARPKDTGVRDKSLLGLPWRYALACTDQLGLILRAEIIWAKPNGLPESVTDRVRRAHEQIFHLVRQPRYYAATDEIREPHTGHSGNDPRPSRSSNDGLSHRAFSRDMSLFNPLGKLPGSVWNIPSQPLQVPARLGVDHFAAFPSELPRRIIAGWSPPGICTACGQGRRPVVDKRLNFDHAARMNRAGRIEGQRTTSGMWDYGYQGATKIYGSTDATIMGYACACPDTTAPTRPSVVVDPFGGTGTTALVASVLGRTGITIDRSRDYCRLAAWRTQDPGERCRVIGAPKPPPIADGQDALFTL